MTQPTPPVSPNAEDISLVLGNVQRVRSYSTTMTPKLPESKLSTSAPVVESPIVGRKKSVPLTNVNTQKSDNRYFFKKILKTCLSRMFVQRIFK